jgi:leucyl/phenylalanyl-tRNA--protein transferase
MFSYATDASKVALVHLVARLNAGGYQLLDTQWTTEHLSQFGAFEVPKSRYRRLLEAALHATGDFNALPKDATPEDVVRWVDSDREDVPQ